MDMSFVDIYSFDFIVHLLENIKTSAEFRHDTKCVLYLQSLFVDSKDHIH